MNIKPLLLGLCTAALALTTLTACAQSNPTFDANAALDALLHDVQYDGALLDISDNAQYYFSGLPDGTAVTMYTAQGTSSDQVILFEAKQQQDVPVIEELIQTHLNSLSQQAANYMPEEVSKIKDALIYTNDVYVLLCITEDTATAKELLP